MPTEIEKTRIMAWARALKSGQYAQVQEVLTDGSGYCCLGVACEVAIQDGLNLTKELVAADESDFDEDEDRYQYDGEGAVLPRLVLGYYGFQSTNPLLAKVKVDRWDNVTDSCVWSGEYRKVPASELNDSFGWSFDRIADAVIAVYINGDDLPEVIRESY